MCTHLMRPREWNENTKWSERKKRFTAAIEMTVIIIKFYGFLLRPPSTKEESICR